MTGEVRHGGIARNFKEMSINELKQHEKGILNLYE
jgi:hypothetical protein